MLLPLSLALGLFAQFPDMVLECSLTTGGAMRGDEAPSAFTLRITGGDRPRLSQVAGADADRQLPVERWTEARGDPAAVGFSFGNGVEGISFRRDASTLGRYAVGWTACIEETDGSLSHCGFNLGGDGFCQVVPSISPSREANP